MSDPRAPAPPDPITVDVLARVVAGHLETGEGGQPTTRLLGVRGIHEAGPHHASFVSNRRYLPALSRTRAAVVLLDPHTPSRGRTVIRLADPYLGFARALALFHPRRPVRPGVHPRAVVAPDAVVEGAEIGALACVGAGAHVGAGSRLDPGAVVGENARVGRDCHLMPHAVVMDGCELGDRVILNPGAVVGGEGFGFAPTAEGHVKIPQVGRAVVEDDVEIGANSCVDRAAMADTRVGRGAKLDNLVQVGHAARIGEHDLLVAYAGVAGSSRLGRFVTLAAKAGVLGHLEVGDHVKVGARGLVTRNQPAGAHVSGYPAFDHRQWRRSILAFRDLPALLRTVRRLRRRVDALAARIHHQEE